MQLQNVDNSLDRVINLLFSRFLIQMMKSMSKWEGSFKTQKRIFCVYFQFVGCSQCLALSFKGQSTEAIQRFHPLKCNSSVLGAGRLQ